MKDSHMCADPPDEESAPRSKLCWTWSLAATGVVGASIALVTFPHQAHEAAGQTWAPFVLVTGLLLVGLVAEDDGLFRTAGSQLARMARHGVTLFIGATLLIVVVTATLNLDTSVVFLTPILIAAARHRNGGERPLLYGSLLLANASSLFLPGSNLTNLIVFSHQPLSGDAFLALMWPAAVVAPLVTACVLGAWARRDFAMPTTPDPTVGSPSLQVGLGIVAVAAAVLLVVTLQSPALPVFAVGVVASLIRLAQRRVSAWRTWDVLGVPVLVGLFGITIGLGTVGRVWSGPATLLSHASGAGAAVIASVCSVLFNNLPAASLLAARNPHHAAQLLVGLNLGPNLFVSGSLAWFLWLRVARSSGAEPMVRQATRLGAIVVPLSIAAALGALALAGSG
jgi:arsenical pump membrane protein